MSKCFDILFPQKSFYIFTICNDIFFCEDNAYIRASAYQTYNNVIAFLQNYQHYI